MISISQTAKITTKHFFSISQAAKITTKYQVLFEPCSYLLNTPHKHLYILLYCDGWVQGCSISSTLAMEILQSCTKSSIEALQFWHHVHTAKGLSNPPSLWKHSKYCHIWQIFLIYFPTPHTSCVSPRVVSSLTRYFSIRDEKSL